MCVFFFLFLFRFHVCGGDEVQIKTNAQLSNIYNDEFVRARTRSWKSFSMRTNLLSRFVILCLISESGSCLRWANNNNQGTVLQLQLFDDTCVILKFKKRKDSETSVGCVHLNWFIIDFNFFSITRTHHSNAQMSLNALPFKYSNSECKIIIHIGHTAYQIPSETKNIHRK